MGVSAAATGLMPQRHLDLCAGLTEYGCQRDVTPGPPAIALCRSLYGRRCFSEANHNGPGFYALQNVEDEDEVIPSGFFDGSLEELRARQAKGGYGQRRQA